MRRKNLYETIFFLWLLHLRNLFQYRLNVDILWKTRFSLSKNTCPTDYRDLVKQQLQKGVLPNANWRGVPSYKIEALAVREHVASQHLFNTEGGSLLFFGLGLKTGRKQIVVQPEIRAMCKANQVTGGIIADGYVSRRMQANSHSLPTVQVARIN